MDSDELTEEQNQALAHFQEFTQIDSTETAIQYLSNHDWDVERAIDTALISTSEPSTPEPTTTATTTELPQTPLNTSLVARYVPNYAMQLFRMPLSFLYTFYLKLQPFLPWRMLRVAFTFFRSFLWTRQAPPPLPPRPVPIPPNPLREIEEYCAYFNAKYGSEHVTFYRGTLSQALRDAQREVRLLFIYLHEKNSAACDRFCHEVLCQEALRSTVGSNLLWSSSRDTQEGAQAARLLDTTVFPCFCIIAHHGSQQTIQLKLDRLTDADECLAEIINGVQNADQVLEHNRERRNQSQSRHRLLEEQNAAYLDSLRADQEKAEQRQKEEAERRLVEEEEQRKLQEFVDFRERVTQALPSEPSASEDETIQVSIRLPADEPIRRRFRKTESAKLLFEFAWSNSSVPDQFELLWGYPRKRYQYEQIGDETIGDLIKGNTETCFLEQIDDEK